MIIDIKPKTIFMILIVISLFSLGLQLKPVFEILFFAFILYCAYLPIVKLIEKRRVKRPLAILIVLAITILVLVIIGTIISVPVVDQFNRLAKYLPGIITNVLNWITTTFPQLKDQINPTQIVSQITGTGTQSVISIVTNIGNLFGNILAIFFNILIVLVMTSFMLSLDLTNEKVRDLMKRLVEDDYEKAKNIINKVIVKIGLWVRTQLLICLTSAIITSSLFAILGFEFAIPIGVLAGFLELIPNFGPALQLPIAAIIALATGASPILVLVYAIVIIIWQQIQNNILVPKLMHKTVGLNPLITLLAVLSGTQLLGIVGAIIAIPIAAILQITIEEYFELK